LLYSKSLNVCCFISGTAFFSGASIISYLPSFGVD